MIGSTIFLEFGVDPACKTGKKSDFEVVKTSAEPMPEVFDEG